VRGLLRDLCALLDEIPRRDRLPRAAVAAILDRADPPRTRTAGDAS
jgi:hypothetical protein